LLGSGQSNAKFGRMSRRLKIDGWDLLCMNPITCLLRPLHRPRLTAINGFVINHVFHSSRLVLYNSCYFHCGCRRFVVIAAVICAVVPSLSPLSLCRCLQVDISVVFVSPSSSSRLYCHRLLICHVIVIIAVAVFLVVIVIVCLVVIAIVVFVSSS